LEETFHELFLISPWKAIIFGKTVNTQQNHGFLKLRMTIKMQDGTMPTENHRGGISNFLLDPLEII
jgi:hypothetical protein